MVCVQIDEIIYNTFVLRYSGTEYSIGFPFASGKSNTFFRRTRVFSREGGA